MDFGALLDYAKQNELPNKEVKCYRTTFGPPKKEPKSKCLSDNIRKFLAKKEEEEKLKLDEANKKREELLALRSQDKKANKRVQAMLKSTKAANKAVIDDARDDVNTAVTMAGPSQPDEDDYGYVSQEASAFYNKLMDKYSNIPNSDPNFSKKTATVKDLTSTKDRVRMALLKEEEEESMGHKRKRRKKEDRKQDDDDDDANIHSSAPDRRPLHEDSSRSKYSRDVHEKPEPEVKKKRPPAPPPMDFAQLLKVAAQKQFEPIKIEKKDSKAEEEERPMTKKQKEEYLREKQYRQRREEMAKAAAAAKSKEKPQPRASESQVTNSESKSSSPFKTPAIPRIPKLNGAKANPDQNRVSGSDNEARRSVVPQQTESREGISNKQRMAEGARPGGARPPSSSREQERMTSEVKRNNMQSSSRTYETDRKPIQNVPSPKDRRDKVELEGRKQPANHTSRPVMKDEQRLSKTAAVREERPVNSQSSRPVMKDEQRQSSQLSKTAAVREERPVNSQSSRPVMKDEQRLSKTAAVREERPVNSQSSRPVMKDERRMSNQPQRPKEDPRPSPASREPQKSLKPGSSLASKPNRPVQGSAGTKPSQNVMKKVEGKSVTPAAGDMLRERLNSCSNQSLPQKSQPGSSQMVKKDLKMRPPEKSKNTAPSTETSLPKGVPSRLSGATPSGVAKEKIKSLPPERKPETSAVNRKPQMDDRRPSMPERKPSAVVERGPTSDRRPPSMAERRPPSMGDRRPPSMGDRRPPSMGDRRPLSMGDRRPPSMGDRRPFAGRGRPMHPQDARRRPPAKRRIESDDEYDSELDDFIDDGPEEGEDYSKYIKEIFGYDKSRYRGRDFEEDDEDECMESSFAQQMKEEFVSTKLGILEDLEDIKKEQMEKMKMKKKKMMTTAKKKKL